MPASYEGESHSLRRLRTPLEVDRDERRARGELEMPVTMAEKRAAMNIGEIEERNEQFRQ